MRLKTILFNRATNVQIIFVRIASAMSVISKLRRENKEKVKPLSKGFLVVADLTNKNFQLPKYFPLESKN